MRSVVGSPEHHVAAARPQRRLPARCTFAACAAVRGSESQALLALVEGTDSGAGASPELRGRVLELASAAEASYTEDARTSPLLVGDWRVSYTSSPQAAGGRFRSGLGRALFRTHALYQNVEPGSPPVVVNRVEFLLFGCVPGWIGLRGPLKPVEPLVVTPRQEVQEGDGVASPTAGVTRTYDGAVEVAFEPPQLTVAGSTVSLGGPSSVRLATTFLDERLRIGRGGFGSLFLFERMPPGAQAAAALPVPSYLRAVGWLLCRAALSIVFVVSAIADAARLSAQLAGRPLTLLGAAIALLGVAVTGGMAPPVLAVIREAALPSALSGGGHLLCCAAWLGGALSAVAAAKGASEGALAASLLAGGAALLFLPATGLATGPEGLLGASRLLRWAMGALLAQALWAQPSAERLARFVAVNVAQQGSGTTAAIGRLQARLAGWRGREGALTVFAIGALAWHLAGLGSRLV